jgi:hypothetical protein
VRLGGGVIGPRWLAQGLAQGLNWKRAFSRAFRLGSRGAVAFGLSVPGPRGRGREEEVRRGESVKGTTIHEALNHRRSLRNPDRGSEAASGGRAKRVEHARIEVAVGLLDPEAAVGAQ